MTDVLTASPTPPEGAGSGGRRVRSGRRRGYSVRGPGRRRVAAVAVAVVAPLVAVQLVIAPVMALVGASGAAAAAPAPAGVRTGTAQVSGSGFGHGVGMSQYGALGMARAGASATQILQHYYTGVTVAAYPDNRDVRVNVVHSARTLTLGSTARAANGGSWRLSAAGRAPQVLGPDDSASLTVANGSGANGANGAGGSGGSGGSGGMVAVVVRHGSLALPAWTASAVTVQWAGTRALPGPATTLDVVSRRIGSSTTKQRSYRWGTVQVSAVAGALEAVAAVGLHEEYLRGVAEVPSSWPPAALQAQVVAARNYALAAATAPRPACGGCQLWDDQRSQVYVGWEKESERGGSPSFGERWVAAVRATELSATTGLSVLYQGRPVVAYFSSSTGGRTRDVQDVWGGGGVPYLRSVADPWSLDGSLTSYARWSRSVSVARLRSVFGLSDLVSVRVSARDGGGAARTVTAKASDGATASVSGERFRAALGLPGSWVAAVTLPLPPVTPPPAPPQPAPSSAPSSSSPSSGSGAGAGGGTGGGTGTAAVRDPLAGLNAAVGGAVRAVPPVLVARGLPVTEWSAGRRVVAGRVVTTACAGYDHNGYRCLVSIDGRADHATYFHAYLRAWFGGPLTTVGRHVVAGRATSTLCSPAATGARLCRLLTWTPKPAGSSAAGAGRWVVSAVTHLGGG